MMLQAFAFPLKVMVALPLVTYGLWLVALRTDRWVAWLPSNSLAQKTWELYQDSGEPNDTYLRYHDWPMRNLTAAEIHAYRRDGSVAVKDAFPKKAIQDLLRYAESNPLVADAGYAVSTWINFPTCRSNIVRDFVAYSPAGRYASQALGSAAVVFRSDFLTGMGSGDSGHCWHSDRNPLAFPENRSDVLDITVWVPLSAINKHTGGSLVVANNSLLTSRCRPNRFPFQIPADCWGTVDEAGITFELELGDALLFDGNSLHKSQAPARGSGTRWSLVLRMSEDSVADKSIIPGLLQNKSDSKGHDPQIYPAPDVYEMLARHRRKSHEFRFSKMKKFDLWVKWVLVQGWLYRKVWPQWKKCIFGATVSWTFEGRPQFPWEGRFGSDIKGADFND